MNRVSLDYEDRARSLAEKARDCFSVDVYRYYCVLTIARWFVDEEFTSFAEAEFAAVASDAAAVERARCAGLARGAAAVFDGLEVTDDLRSRCEAARGIAAAIEGKPAERT